MFDKCLGFYYNNSRMVIISGNVQLEEKYPNKNAVPAMDIMADMMSVSYVASAWGVGSPFSIPYIDKDSVVEMVSDGVYKIEGTVKIGSDIVHVLLDESTYEVVSDVVEEAVVEPEEKEQEELESEEEPVEEEAVEEVPEEVEEVPVEEFYEESELEPIKEEVSAAESEHEPIPEITTNHMEEKEPDVVSTDKFGVNICGAVAAPPICMVENESVQRVPTPTVISGVSKFASINIGEEVTNVDNSLRVPTSSEIRAKAENVQGFSTMLGYATTPMVEPTPEPEPELEVQVGQPIGEEESVQETVEEEPIKGMPFSDLSEDEEPVAMSYELPEVGKIESMTGAKILEGQGRTSASSPLPEGTKSTMFSLDEESFLNSLDPSMAEILQKIPASCLESNITEYTNMKVNAEMLNRDGEAYCTANRWHVYGSWYYIDVTPTMSRYFFNANEGVSADIPMSIYKKWRMVHKEHSDE